MPDDLVPVTDPNNAPIPRQTPRGFSSVMSHQRDSDDNIQYFPTPPWATRAFANTFLTKKDTVWEPACGKLHMADTLASYAKEVYASDIVDYKFSPTAAVGSYIGDDALVFADTFHKASYDWLVTNPPFKLAERFAQRGLNEAVKGVALFERSVWSEGVGRYNNLFRDHPPTYIYQFSERVPIVGSRYDPDARSATAYAWFVWDKRVFATRETLFRWFPPGTRKRYELSYDRTVYAGR